MSADADEPTTIRFRSPGPSHSGVHAALEGLANAIANAETDDTHEVEGFQFDMTGAITLPGPRLNTPEGNPFCIRLVIHTGPDGKQTGSSCLVDWR